MTLPVMMLASVLASMLAKGDLDSLMLLALMLPKDNYQGLI
jgi:hypothetical protein